MERNNEEILQLITQYLNKANAEEKEVLSSILNGLIDKQSGKYSTYLAGLTKLSGRFLDNNDYEITIPIQPIVHNPLKIVHGGITATLLDTTMGTIVNKKLSKELAVVTTEIKVNYIKPGVGKELRCVATLLHQGKHLAFVEGKVYSDNNEMIASASGTFFIVKRPM